MNVVSFEALAQKFEILSDQAKEEVYDFIEFLIEKKKQTKKKINKKKILLGMSCWDDEDIKILDDVRDHMNQWKPETF
jgi:flavodoxin